MNKFCNIFLSLILLMLVGCGFHLRGKLLIPSNLQAMQIVPNISYDPFQRFLRQTLKSNDVRIIEPNDPEAKTAVILTILNQSFSERTVGYGADGQTNRTILQFTANFQVSEPNGKVLIPTSTIQVERELTVNPNAVLGTENERERVKQDLYMDATSQMMRQISVSEYSSEHSHENSS